MKTEKVKATLGKGIYELRRCLDGDGTIGEEFILRHGLPRLCGGAIAFIGILLAVVDGGVEG